MVYDFELRTPYGTFHYFVESKRELEMIGYYFDSKKRVSDEFMEKMSDKFRLKQSEVAKVLRDFLKWYSSIKKDAKKGKKPLKNIEPYFKRIKA